MYVFISCIAILTLFACQPTPTDTSVNHNKQRTVAAVDSNKPAAAAKVVKDTVPTPTSLPNYTWVENYESANSIAQQIPVPQGFQRVSVEAGSFGEWLRYLPLQAAGSPVMLYSQAQKPYQAGAHRLIHIDIGKRDLQQCADAVMRLKAEYHYAHKDYDQIHFNYTSGDKIAFSDWAKGRKPRVSGSRVTFSSPTSSTDWSYRNFKRYLTNVFMYAGTASLEKEMQKQAIENMKAGDVFIQGGFPGHAIIVIDVAKHIESGQKIFLLAQSYMPAQSIHILNNFNNEELSPWYTTDFGAQLQTPEWTFERQSLKRFE